MFGIRLKELRQNHNMTQSELAEILNVSSSAISHYENETREPSEHIIVTVAKYFNVTCDYLLGMETASKIIDTESAILRREILDINRLINKLNNWLKEIDKQNKS